MALARWIGLGLALVALIGADVDPWPTPIAIAVDCVVWALTVFFAWGAGTPRLDHPADWS